jgi:hypothetical protein
MAQKKPAKIEIGGKKFKIGNAVGSGEFRKIAEATGRPLSDLRERILNKGFSLGSSGKNYYKQNKNTVNQQDSEQGMETEHKEQAFKLLMQHSLGINIPIYKKTLAKFKQGLLLKVKEFEVYLIKRLQGLIRMRLIMVTIVSLKELSTLRTPKSVGGKLLPQSRATRKRPSKTSLTPA